MLFSLTTGIVLGLSAGISPGPLLTLVLAYSLRQGARAGIKLSFAPLITDLPILTAAICAVAWLDTFEPALGVITLAGAAFLVYLGYENLRGPGLKIAEEVSGAGLIAKGTLVNALNPNPYLFWLTVGAPLTRDAWAKSPLAAAAFLGAFYTCLTGSKMLIAVLAGKSRDLLSGKAHTYMLRFLGLALLCFAAVFAWKGLGLLGLW